MMIITYKESVQKQERADSEMNRACEMRPESFYQPKENPDSYVGYADEIMNGTTKPYC